MNDDIELAGKVVTRLEYSAYTKLAIKTICRILLSPHAPLDIHPEVAQALSARKPVVALETALVTNGIAPPTNLAIGLKLEEIVRAQGAVPATIGIVEGRVKVGLERAQMERLADVGEGKRKKVKVCDKLWLVVGLRRLMVCAW